MVQQVQEVLSEIPEHQSQHTDQSLSESVPQVEATESRATDTESSQH
jgi:hypothetical protein